MYVFVFAFVERIMIAMHPRTRRVPPVFLKKIEKMVRGNCSNRLGPGPAGAEFPHYARGDGLKVNEAIELPKYISRYY